ncbi:MAG TPA: PASTA domain-containing protein [Solirubrobacterales bacterium]
MLVVTALAWLALCVSASATSATVTLGSPLQELGLTSQCPAQPCELVQTSLPQSGAAVISPMRGVVVTWSMLGGSSSFPYRLQVLSPGPEGSYTATGSSAPSVPTGPGLQTFATAIPIQAGQVIAIELQAGAPLAYAPTLGADFDRLTPPLVDGGIGTATPGSSFELGFNAEIAPEFAIPAETPVTGTVPTPAATGACRVPGLAGRKLAAAKKRIRKAGCRVGKVKKLKGATAKAGVVVKQNPKAGKILAPGAKVHVKLGQ